MAKMELKNYCVLLVALLTASTAWADSVKYYDSSAAIGEQRKTVNATALTSQTSLGSGWYYVSGTVTISNRITVNGTVNLILTDGCDFTASKGIQVASGKTLNIYAQSTGNNRGSLTAGRSNGDRDGHDAAIGGNGGANGDHSLNADQAEGSAAEEAGNITIYGGNITTTGNLGGGDGGEGYSYTEYYGGGEYYDYFGGIGGNGGSCGTITIYSGIITVNGTIGGGSGGNGDSTFGEGKNGANGSGTVTLYWANASDRITAAKYQGTVSLEKDFVDSSTDQRVDNKTIGGKTIKPEGTPHAVIVSAPDGVTVDVDLAEEGGKKYAIKNQIITFSYSDVPESYHLEFSAEYPSMLWDSDMYDDGDNIKSFYMPSASDDVTLRAGLVFTLKRTLYKDGDWNTLCLPFDMIKTGYFTDATIMELDVDGMYNDSGVLDNETGTHKTGYEAATNTLTLNFKETSTIEAGKPYLVKWASPAEDLVNPIFQLDTWITYPEIGEVTSADGYVSFAGTFEGRNFNADDNSILFLGEANTLYYPESGASIGAFCAYFQLNNGLTAGEASAGIRSFNLNFGDNETTAIEAQPISNVQSSMFNEDAWYTIDGRKLNGAPTAKGLYIHNGKKTIKQ